MEDALREQLKRQGSFSLSASQSDLSKFQNPENSKEFNSIIVSAEQQSQSKDYNKVELSRKQGKLANMITRKTPRKTPRKKKESSKFIIVENTVTVDMSEIRKKFK